MDDCSHPFPPGSPKIGRPGEDPRPRTHRATSALVAAAVILGSGCGLENFYITSSYPKDTLPTPERDWSLVVSSSLEPGLLTAYDNPADVAVCLGKLDRGALATTFAQYGQCVDGFSPTKQVGGKTTTTTRAEALAWCLPRLTSIAPGVGVVGCSLADHDAVALARVLAGTAESFHSLKKSLSGGGFGDPDLSPALSDKLRTGLDESLDLAARLLAAEAPQPGENPVRRSQLPALALSGGAANGAFTAGYMYAMLSLRELAIESLEQGYRDEIERSERIGTIVSTSVGTLVALAADLYFTPAGFSADPATRKLEDARLRRCLAPDRSQPLGQSEPLPARPFQQCALKELVDDFHSSEWDLLCYEDEELLDLLSNLDHVLQFAPMKRGILTPVLDAFQSRMLDNDLVRVAMAVDFDQNVVVGLDERACRLGTSPPWRTECLASAALASVVLPVFTRPVSRVYSGLRRENGESGTWFDGGIRSETPAFRALAMTRNKALAINTTRAEGVPNLAPRGALGVTLATMNQFTQQVRSTELALAPTKDTADDDDQKILDAYLHLPSAGAVASEAQPLTGKLRTVYVPEEITPKILFADGYSFDPWVMQGLFLWGEKTFLQARTRRATFAWLGWNTLRNLESTPAELAALSAACPRNRPACVEGPRGAAEYRRKAKKLSDDVEAELRRKFTVDEASLAFKDWYRRHKADRRKLMNDRLEKCQAD